MSELNLDGGLCYNYDAVLSSAQPRSPYLTNDFCSPAKRKKIFMGVHLSPYLVLKKNARAGIAFYERALEGKVQSMTTYGDVPADGSARPTKPEFANLIVHADISFGQTHLLLCDNYPGNPIARGNQVMISLTADDIATARRCFDALAEGGEVTHALTETSFSPAFGMVKDKYGVNFTIVSE
ncbi:VOC family protein [Paenibacillus sp. IB182496]|uniref:VOC family protein n=1 Tax=Paenibacillus sabuli TaxID=2772509 RepID=A0A927BPC1_9BACL|nr:VOC family protein [Paenibacillus sabuli]MBD2844257.1 VOC family protein [Paenibacillus sabuli]